MSFELESHINNLKNKSAKELNARSHSFDEALQKADALKSTIKNPGFGDNYPLYDISDPMSQNYMQNARRLGSTLKTLTETTVPKLQNLKRINDDVLVEKVQDREKRQLEALPIEEEQRPIFITHLESEFNTLQSLYTQGYLDSDIPVRIASSRVELMKNFKPTVQKEAPKTPVVQEQKGDQGTFTLPNGAIIDASNPMKMKILEALFAKNLDKGEMAERIFGKNTPEYRDIVDMWINKVSLEDLATAGYSIVEVQHKSGKVVCTALEESNIQEEFKEIQQALTPPEKRPEEIKKDQHELVPQSQIPESRYITLEYIFSTPLVTRENIIEHLGKTKNGRSFTWTVAFRSLSAATSKISSRVNHGTASEREKKIFEKMMQFAPNGFTPNQAGKLFGREIERILGKDEEGSFVTKSSEQPQIEKQTINIPVETEKVIQPVEIQADKTVTVAEQPKPSEDKSGIAELARSLLSSGIELPEEMKTLTKKIAEETDKTGKDPDIKLIRRIKLAMSNDDDTLEFIGSFDDFEMQEFLFWVIDNSEEVMKKLLPQNADETDNFGFEIGPNGAIRFITSEAETPKAMAIETQIPDIRDMVRKRLQEVNQRIYATDSLNFNQVISAFREIQTRDIRISVGSKFVRPKAGSDGKEIFNQQQIATIMLTTKDLKKNNLSNRMKKELADIIEEEAKKLDEESEKK